MRTTTTPPLEQAIRLLRLLIPPQWLQQNLNVFSYIPNPTETSSPNNILNQAKVVDKWNGVCDKISQITQPRHIYRN